MNDSFNRYNRLNGLDSINDELEMDLMECTTKSCSALELYRIPLSSSTCIPTAICVQSLVTQFSKISRAPALDSRIALALSILVLANFSRLKSVSKTLSLSRLRSCSHTHIRKLVQTSGYKKRKN